MPPAADNLDGMTTIARWLADAALHAPLAWVALTTILWFAAIYVLIAGGACVLAIDGLPGEVASKDGRTQRRAEELNSLGKFVDEKCPPEDASVRTSPPRAR